MLSLKIADKEVDLPNDFSCTMNLKSQIFGEVGSYSYPFKLPNTPRNAGLMGFRHRVENTGDVYQTDQGAFLWKGINLFQGSVKLKTLNSKAFEGAIFESEGDFYYSRKNLSLQDVDFGEIDLVYLGARTTWINDCIGKVYPERPIAFPQVRNETYFDVMPTDPELLNFNYYSNGLLLNVIYWPPDPSVIVPMLYLRYVLDKIFEKLGYVFDDSFFSSDPDYNSLVLYNSVNCNENDESGYFHYPLYKILYNYHVPRMTINDFFYGLESFFNIRFFVNNRNKTVKLISLDSIIKSIDYCNSINKIISVSTEPEDPIFGYKFEMDLDSDDGTQESIATTDEVKISYIKTPVNSVNDLPVWPAATELDIRYVIETDSFYRMTSGTWILFDMNDFITHTKYQYKSIIGESISTKVSPVLERVFAPGEWVEAGNKQINWKEITPRLFFVTPYYENGTFYMIAGTSYTDGTSLCYNGNTGLFNKQFKSFIDFRMSTKLVKIIAQLDYNVIKDFDFSRKYMINGINYLVKSIQVTLKKDRIMPALLECYPCP